MFVFLDIDGVMVPAKSWKSPPLLPDGFYQFSDDAVRVLQGLVADNTTLVLTTSHKSRFTLQQWKNIFERRGIRLTRLKKLDTSTPNLNRREEIVRWMNMNGVPQVFIIIDDDKSLNDLPNTLKDQLILTNSTVGLTDAHADEIKAKLKQQYQLAE
jgi:hypothetical protein